MARVNILTNNGETQYREARANGTNAVTVKANATLAGDIDFILPVSLPVSAQVVTIDSAGQLATTLIGAGDLNDAYDFPTAGAGRIITADTGPVEAAGAGGFLVSHSAPVYGFETTGAEYNFRLIAGLTTDILEFQRGDQDGDISNDVFETILSIDGPGRMVGVNTANPQEAFHVNSDGLGIAGKVRIQGDTAFDASVQFYEATTARFEMGYDDSASAFVLAPTSFATPIFSIADTTGLVKIESLAQDGNLLSLDKKVGNTGSALRIDNAANTICIDINKLGTGAGSPINIFNSGTGTGLSVNQSGTAFAAQFKQNSPQLAVQVDQNQNAVSVQIDSEATSSPLLQLDPVTANSRGDIAFGTARTADPSAPAEGDLWYDGTAERMKIKTSLAGVFEGQTVASRYGANYGLRTVETIATGVLTISSGYIQVAAESGTADSLDTITSASPAALPGDTIVLTADIGDTITVTEAGNIVLTGTTRVLGAAGTADTMLLIKKSDGPETWAELSYSDNS